MTTEGYGRIHAVIPDTQVRPGVAVDHLDWISKLFADKLGGLPNVSVIHLGDHWDMPSLSSYDKGRKKMEGRRVDADLQAGNTGMELLSERRAYMNDATEWWILGGNHEDRLTRAAEENAQLDGVLTLDDMEAPGWTKVPFLEPMYLDGVGYAHYWYNPMNGRPYSGLIDTRLKQIGHSFTMGHQQTLIYGQRAVAGTLHHGLVAGACYLHDEDYKGPQGNAHWRGVVICYGVDGGNYSPAFYTLDYLCWRYEGVRLSQFTPRLVLNEDGLLT